MNCLTSGWRLPHAELGQMVSIYPVHRPNATSSHTRSRGRGRSAAESCVAEGRSDRRPTGDQGARSGLSVPMTDLPHPGAAPRGVRRRCGLRCAGAAEQPVQPGPHPGLVPSAPSPNSRGGSAHRETASTRQARRAGQRCRPHSATTQCRVLSRAARSHRLLRHQMLPAIAGTGHPHCMVALCMSVARDGHARQPSRYALPDLGVARCSTVRANQATVRGADDPADLRWRATQAT